MLMSLCPYLLVLIKYPPWVPPWVPPETIYLRLTMGHPVSHHYKAIQCRLSIYQPIRTHYRETL
ncbi:hypothetical protein FBLNLFFT_0002 [Klebsiella phage Amrap]|uniref:Uncharacterized protein n=1 Tax=Klebsiella phage Amrap TaxID=3018530 RepID=A0AAF0D9Q0_9CAUD|nr:hypothetical protein FBLNLFFT_0002 [Klebsiella phage Amrap]